MSPAATTAPAPLIYTQGEDFLCEVGEPIDLTPASRVVIAKADGVCAEAVRDVARAAFPAPETTVFRSGEALLHDLRTRRADFAVLGLTFPDRDGIDILEANANEHLVRRLFILSTRKDDHSLHLLRAARFDGFLDPAEETAAALGPALRQVANGRGYVSPALCRRLIERRTSVISQRLTSAERVVFAVIGAGADDAAAAEQLGVKRATIQSHRRNLMGKLEVTTSARLVAEAIRLGVVRLLPDGKVIRPGFERLLRDWDARRHHRDAAAKALR